MPEGQLSIQLDGRNPLLAPLSTSTRPPVFDCIDEFLVIRAHSSFELGGRWEGFQGPQSCGLEDKFSYAKSAPLSWWTKTGDPYLEI